MPLQRAVSTGAGRDQIRRQFGEGPIFQLFFGDGPAEASAAEADAEHFLERLTFAARTPEGIVIPESIAVLLIGDAVRTNEAGTTARGMSLLIGGHLSDTVCDEVLRKSVQAEAFQEAYGADAVLARGTAAGLFAIKTVEKPSPEWLDALIAVGFVVGLIIAILWFFAWVQSD